MSEIRTHEQVVRIIGILAQEANDDGVCGREELGPQTRQAIEWLSATDAALRAENERLALSLVDAESRLAAAEAEAEENRRTAEAAVKFLGRIGETTWCAGFPGGDRDQTLRNVTAMAGRLAAAEECLREIREWAAHLGWLGSPDDERVQAEVLAIIDRAFLTGGKP